MSTTNLKTGLPTFLDETCVQLLTERGVEHATFVTWVEDSKKMSRNNSVWTVRTLIQHVIQCDSCCLLLSEEPFLASLASQILSSHEHELATTLVNRLMCCMLEDKIPQFIHMLSEQKCKLWEFAEAVALSLGKRTTHERLKRDRVPVTPSFKNGGGGGSGNSNGGGVVLTVVGGGGGGGRVDESLEDWQKRNGIQDKSSKASAFMEDDELDEFSFDGDDEDEWEDEDEGEDEDEVE